MDPRVPMPLLLGPYIGPLNLGRWEGDSNSAWAFNSNGPAPATLCFSLTPDSRPPWAVLPTLQTLSSLCWFAAELIACTHLLVPLGFTDICKYVLLRTNPLHGSHRCNSH